MEGFLVIFVDSQAEIGQEVFDFLTLVEGQSPIDAVGNIPLTQGIFYSTGLHIGTIEHCKITIGKLVLHGLFKDSSCYEASLIGIGRAAVNLDKGTTFVSCPYYLFQAGFVVLNHIVGSLYDIAGRAVVLFQSVDTYIAIVLLEVEDIVNIRPTESVDTLGIVSHYTYVLKPIG